MSGTEAPAENWEGIKHTGRDEAVTWTHGPFFLAATFRTVRDVATFLTMSEPRATIVVASHRDSQYLADDLSSHYVTESG